MDGHHLILGELTDAITGETLTDTHDERYRQKLAGILLNKGYSQQQIIPRRELMVKADNNRAVIKIDFLITMGDQIGMIVRYGPGSLITRHRPSLAASRLLTPYQIPLVVVTNGEDADVLDGISGDRIGSGLEAIPSEAELRQIVSRASFPLISSDRAERESRIVYAYEVDGSCPCDDSICRLQSDGNSYERR